MAENIYRIIIGGLSLWLTVVSPLLWIYWIYERKQMGKHNQRFVYAIVGLSVFLGVLLVMYLGLYKVGFLIIVPLSSWGKYNEGISGLSSIFALIITITVFRLLDKYKTLARENEYFRIILEGNKDKLVELNKQLYDGRSGKTLEDAIIISSANPNRGFWHGEYNYLVKMYGISGINWTMVKTQSCKDPNGIDYDMVTIKLDDNAMNVMGDMYDLINPKDFQHHEPLVDIYFKKLLDFRNL